MRSGGRRGRHPDLRRENASGCAYRLRLRGRRRGTSISPALAPGWRTQSGPGLTVRRCRACEARRLATIRSFTFRATSMGIADASPWQPPDCEWIRPSPAVMKPGLSRVRAATTTATAATPCGPDRHGRWTPARIPNAERDDGEARSEPDVTPRTSGKPTRQGDKAASRGKTSA
jgi:hypothetical protein